MNAPRQTSSAESSVFSPSVWVSMVQIGLVWMGVRDRLMAMFMRVPGGRGEIGMAVVVMPIVVAVRVGVGQRVMGVGVAMAGGEHQEQRSDHQHACAQLGRQHGFAHHQPGNRDPEKRCTREEHLGACGAELLRTCWVQDPAARPSFDAVCAALARMVEEAAAAADSDADSDLGARLLSGCGGSA